MLHVELLRLEQLVDVVDAQPEVLLLVQVVQVGFLSLAQGQKDLLHPDLVLGEHFVHHLVSELIKELSKILLGFGRVLVVLGPLAIHICHEATVLKESSAEEVDSTVDRQIALLAIFFIVDHL